MPSSTSLTTLKNSTLSYENITQTQHQAIDALYEGNRLLIAGVGFGKAMCGQSAAQALLDAGEVSRVLVVAPLKVCTHTWATEWQKWDHLWQPALALGDAAARTAAINSLASIVVINIENLAWLLNTHGVGNFDGLLIDEISKFKTAGGETMKALRKHLKAFKWRAGMSATPVAEAGIDIYAQALIIDGGEALGRNQDRFRRNYFYPTDFQQRKWAILPGGGERLADALRDLVYVADDAGYKAGLPELRDCIVNVTLPPAVRKDYDLFCHEGELHGVEAVNQAVLTGKLSQIAAGFLYTDEGTRWLHYEKFAALWRVLGAAEGPVLVAYWFEAEREELRARCPDMVFLGDGDPLTVERWNAGEISMLALHPKSAAHGLNLQFGGHELVVLSPPWGADPWQQLIGRIQRRGQPSPYVRRTTIVAVDTVDELIIERHVAKEYSEISLMDHFRERSANSR